MRPTQIISVAFKLLLGSIIFGLLLGSLILLIFSKPPQEKPLPFDPKQTTCFIFDMKPAGWTLVTEKNRMEVSLLVAQGKAEWMEAETTTCYRRYPDKSLGDKIILRNEWYQKKKYR